MYYKMNKFIKPTLKKITKDNLLQYTDNCEAMRVGYNANIYPNCKNPNEIVKICLSGQLDFLMEVYAMLVLGPENISPKLIKYYWCDENIKLKDIVTKSAFTENKKIRKFLDYEEEYEGVGIIIMEKIENIVINSNYSEIRSIYKNMVYKKIVKAYKLGFISMEPDVLIFKNNVDKIDVRILDWGNYGGIEQAKDDYNLETLNQTLEYLGLDKVKKDSKIDTGEKIKLSEKVIKMKIQFLKELSRSQFKEQLFQEDLKVLHSVKIYLDDLYYNTGSEGLSDEKYDILKDYLQERDPGYVPPIGTQVRDSENAVSLPFWLGSMNKIKYEGSSESLRRWLNKHKADEYIIENKLDGISCLLEFKNQQIKLYTRGDGSKGSDISYLAPYLKNIPRNLKELKEKIYIRGELIMNKKTFENKYSDEFANPRNMVAGRIGSKTLKIGISDIEFIAYEIVQENILPKPQEQLITLRELGFKVVDYSIIKSSELTSEKLLENLLYNIQESDFEIDGIIVQGNLEYRRNLSGNPDYAFAFKARLDKNLVDVVVDKVEWNISKWGVIKPRIKIKPVSLGGVTITYTSGFNAKYILDNKIGPGSVLKLTRSGDVIPFIIEVVKGSKIAQFPDIEYEWNDTKVDIHILESNQTTCIKLIVSFFAALKIKHVSEATVTKMYEHGLDNIIKIVSAKREDFEKIEGFGSRLAERTYENIQNGFQNVPLYLLLGASGIFGMGMGIKKIELLFNTFPDILEEYKKMKKDDLYQTINGIHGFSDKTTVKIIKNLPWAAKFVEKLSPFIQLKRVETKVSNEFMNKKIVFSGFRDAKLEEEIKKRGGKVTTTVSKNTSMLVALNKEEGSSKIEKAKELNIPIYEIPEFRRNFDF